MPIHYFIRSLVRRKMDGPSPIRDRTRNADPAAPSYNNTQKRSVESVGVQQMEAQRKSRVAMMLTLCVVLTLFFPCARAWTGEIHGRVVCDVCGDSSIGPEDHVLEGAEVAVLCITKSGEVLNYQAFTDGKGIYRVAETMPESDRWDACLARPISSFHEHCTHLGNGTAGIKFTYSRPSGYSHTIRPFVYRPANPPDYCLE